jgi:hypothetical protein
VCKDNRAEILRLRPRMTMETLCGVKRQKNGLPRLIMTHSLPLRASAHRNDGGERGELRLLRRFAPHNDTREQIKPLRPTDTPPQEGN